MEKRPFEGIKVIDFCLAGVGVFILNFLSHYGATTVRVESRTRPDLIRATPPFAQTYAKGENPGLERSSTYACTHPAKEYGMSLNLKHPKGVETFKRLVAWADKGLGSCHGLDLCRAKGNKARHYYDAHLRLRAHWTNGSSTRRWQHYIQHKYDERSGWLARPAPGPVIR